ncbi:MAG TPA: hypothetical protein VHS96_18505, partial [Bacteroidia bacterium]|nr:hypothetical protein [Bacteroidia bacterium]
FNLIRMGDEFWSQGMSTSGLSLLDEPIEEFGKGIPPLLMTPEEHGKWLDAVQLHERKFVEVVGGYLGIFPSSKEAVAAQAAVYQAIAEEITGKPAEKMPKLELGGLGKNQPVAMYFVPGMGITFCINTPMVIDYLQHPETSKLHRNEVTNTLFRYIHPFMVDHILHHYPIARLGWEGMDIDLVKEAKFLSTYFFPEEAGPPKPSITLIDDMD